MNSSVMAVIDDIKDIGFVTFYFIKRSLWTKRSHIEITSSYQLTTRSTLLDWILEKRIQIVRHARTYIVITGNWCPVLVGPLLSSTKQYFSLLHLSLIFRGHIHRTTFAPMGSCRSIFQPFVHVDVQADWSPDMLQCVRHFINAFLQSLSFSQIHRTRLQLNSKDWFNVVNASITAFSHTLIPFIRSAQNVLLSQSQLKNSNPSLSVARSRVAIAREHIGVHVEEFP